MTKKRGNRPTYREKIQQLMEMLEEGVENFVHDEETLMAIFEMKILMPSYSFRNLYLARTQLPGAVYLAGYKRWKELGRYVKKGEKAINILAPRFRKKEDETTKEEKQVLVGFVPVPVFDYSQTDGEPLPIEKVKIELEGDSPEAREIISFAEQIAEKDGCSLTYGDAGDANGYYKPFDHAIVVSDKLSINHRCKTLVHELVHSKVDRLDTFLKTSKEEKEVVAEGVAYIVCGYFGLDTSDYSFNYVHGWSGAGKNLTKYAEKVCDTAGLIISEFESLKEKTQKNEATLAS